MSLYAAKCSRSFPSNKLTVIKMDDPPALKGPFPVPITPLARVDTGSLTVSHLRVTPVMFFHHSGVFTLRVFTEGDLVTLTNKSSSIYLDITFSREVSCETWAWNLACKGAFSPACSVRFWSYARFSPQAQEIRRFWKGRNLVLCMWQQALDMGHLSSAWQAHYFLHAAKKRWQAWMQMRRSFRRHFSWQAQYLVNFDDVASLSLRSFS